MQEKKAAEDDNQDIKVEFGGYNINDEDFNTDRRLVEAKGTKRDTQTEGNFKETPKFISSQKVVVEDQEKVKAKENHVLKSGIQLTDLQVKLNKEIKKTYHEARQEADQRRQQKIFKLKTQLTLDYKHRVEYGLWETIKINLLILWDGVGFFGHSFHKLPRCEGIKFKWWHRFKDQKTILLNVIFIAAMISIIVSETRSLG